MTPDESPDSEPSSWMLEQRLLWLLERYGIKTVAELQDFVNDAAPRAPEIFRRLVELSARDGEDVVAQPEGLLLFLLLVLNRADSDTVNLTERRQEIALNVMIGNPLPPEVEEAEEP